MQSIVRTYCKRAHHLEVPSAIKIPLSYHVDSAQKQVMKISISIEKTEKNCISNRVAERVASVEDASVLYSVCVVLIRR